MFAAPTDTNSCASKPRVAGEREMQILEGVIEVLLELGYDRMTFDSVASHVRASKATLYRKWPTKAALTMAAIEQLVCPLLDQAGPPDTGTLRGDLEAAFLAKQAFADRLQPVMVAVLPALHRDEELTAAMQQQFIAPRQQAMIDMFERARDRGEVAADVDIQLASTILPAMNFHYLLTHSGAPTPEYVSTVIDSVIMPAVAPTKVAVSH